LFAARREAISPALETPAGSFGPGEEKKRCILHLLCGFRVDAVAVASREVLVVDVRRGLAVVVDRAAAEAAAEAAAARIRAEVGISMGLAVVISGFAVLCVFLRIGWT